MIKFASTTDRSLTNEAKKILDGFRRCKPVWPADEKLKNLTTALIASPDPSASFFLDVFGCFIRSSEALIHPDERKQTPRAIRSAATRLLKALSDPLHPIQGILDAKQKRQVLHQALFAFIPFFESTGRQLGVLGPKQLWRHHQPTNPPLPAFPWSSWPALFSQFKMAEPASQKDGWLTNLVLDIWMADRLEAAGNRTVEDPGVFWFAAFPIKNLSDATESCVSMLQTLRDVAVTMDTTQLDHAAAAHFLARLSEHSPAIAARFQINFEKEILTAATEPSSHLCRSGRSF